MNQEWISYRGWAYLFHLSDSWFLESHLRPILFLFSLLFFFVFIISPFYLLLNFTERKWMADIQARVGPSRVGLHGVGQPLSDVLKLIFKNKQKKNVRISLEQGLLYGFSFALFAVLPLGSQLLFFNSELNVLISFLFFLFYSFVLVLVNISEQKPEQFLFEVKKGPRIFLVLLPVLINVLVVGVLSKSFNWASIAQLQEGGVLHWNVFSNPIGFLSFVLFLFSGLLAFQLPPFLMIQEVKVFGIERVFKGGTRFFMLFAWLVFATVLYLGAWNFWGKDGFWLSVGELFSVLIKVFLLFLIVRLIGKTVPNVRYEQSERMLWFWVIPLSALCLAGSIFWEKLW